MKRPLFTPEELAELAAFDAEVDAQPGYDPEEIKAQRRRDTEMRWDGLSNAERAIAEYQRAYYEANRDTIAEYQRAYREANRDTIAEKKRAYYEANKDSIAEYQLAKYHETTSDQNAETSPLRHWRRRNRLTQKAAAMLLGVTQPQISFYERGFTPIPANVMEAIT